MKLDPTRRFSSGFLHFHGVLAPVATSILLAAIAGTSPAQEEKPAAAPGRVAEDPAATSEQGPAIVEVDGFKITQAEVDRLFNARFQQRLENLPAARVEEIRSQMRPILVDELLSKRLFLKEAKNRKIAVNQKMVEDTYRQFASGFKSEKELNDYLQLIQRTPEVVRREIAEEQMIQNLLQDELKKTVNPPGPEQLEAELKKLYETYKDRFMVPEKVKARHILFSTRGETREGKIAEKEAQAQALRKILAEDENADFAEVARKHSDCPSHKDGGNLGEFERGKMVPEFEKAAFSQKVGEIGPVVKTEFGYHIIQVQSHSAAERISFEEAKAGMAAEYLRNQQKEATKEFIQALKAKSDIEWIDASARSSGG